MNISLKKTIAQIDRCLVEGGGASADQLHKMYDLTLRLQSQLLSVIYDIETFGGSTERIANAYSGGKNKDSMVTLTITEPLPSMKRLTEAVEEHWKAMIHAAIGEAAQQRPHPILTRRWLRSRSSLPEETTTPGCGIPPTERSKWCSTI